MKRTFILLLVCSSLLFAQSTRQTEGLRVKTPGVHVLKNLTIVPSPGKRIEKGTIVIRDGIIQSVGAGIAVPADAREWDGTGLTAYAGMIDLFTDYGQLKPKSLQPGSQPEILRGAKYWNAGVRSENSAAELFLPEKEIAEKFRSEGITTVLSVPVQGLFKGSSAVVNTGDGTPNDELMKKNLYQHVSLQQSGSGDAYPNSLMGRIALIRQTIIDAQWYAAAQKAFAKNPNQPRPEENASLASLEEAVGAKQKMVIETEDELSVLRAAAIAREFNLSVILRGSGYEYRRLEAIKAVNAPMIIPVNFPDPPAVGTPEDAFNAGYEELRHWDFAAENPARLKKAGILFALTSNKLKDISAFRKMIKTAVDCGLHPDDALASVTTIPAALIGMERNIGSLEPGKSANIVVTEGEIFGERSKIRAIWIEGKRYEITADAPVDIRGTWSLFMTRSAGGSDTARLDISGEEEKPSVQILRVSSKTKGRTFSVTAKNIAYSFDGDSIGINGIVQLSGAVTDTGMIGIIDYPDGSSGQWTARKLSSFISRQDTTDAAVSFSSSNELLYPDGAFGRRQVPLQQDLLIKNATLWTSGPQGNLEQTDLLIIKGKIAKIGKNLSAPGSFVIDGSGKHITPGLIDAHSHTAITGGVNESGQAVTAEVRIGDVINSDDINIYRQLAGGLTIANQLHGSANAIGGQNSVIKLRWGMLPEQMKMEGAIPGIKFALGENPKQSNWGDRYTERYPQTRMGVEQIIRDEFIAAKEYEAAHKQKQTANQIPPRRDLELETMVEILNSKRLIHSHCYRQDEILMLLNVSDDFGFTIGTLQHVLEGYKVADEIARRNVGASLFSDWWAYKYEVIDAIPYAGKLMHDAGVLVSYNSDSNEMARRMNWEAAKAVKYGGMSEIDALKFVTINPAKQLRIDHRVGSLEVGKDGDVVVWNGHPLSTYSKCEQTWIEGRKFFDVQEDSVMRADVMRGKAELVQKALKSKKKGSGQNLSMPQRSSVYSCHEEHSMEAFESEVQ